MRIFAGATIWCFVAMAGWFGLTGYLVSEPRAASQLARYFTTSARQLEFEFETPMAVRVGDPVMLFEDDSARMVGVIRHVASADSKTESLVTVDRAFAELFGSAPEDLSQASVTYHSTPDSMGWVLQTMLPSETREKIRQLVIAAYQDHQVEIAQELQPLFEQTIRDATSILKESLRESMRNRDAQIQRLGRRYQRELVEGKLVPLVKEEIWPVIEQVAQPLVIEMGQQLWAEASIWRFGWRLLYDRTPLPERNLAQQEFERFVLEKARPLIEARMPEIIAIQQEILTRVSRNGKVKKTVSDSLRTVMKDEEFQLLAADVVRDVLVGNQRLQKALIDNWNSPQAQRALQITNQRLEPMVTKIGQALFGSPESAINPEFSRVLRSEIMQKDQRWFVLQIPEVSDGLRLTPERLRVKRASVAGPDPFYFPSRIDR
ncbi:MAG: hypothetical protein MK106_15500 [Mariniblastus sp.]|nr:hypothetical protein [Mariniblastus sp.]